MKTLTQTLTFAALVLAASQASAQVAVFSGSGETAEGRKVPIIKEGEALRPGEIQAIDVLTELPALDKTRGFKTFERALTVPTSGGRGERRFKACWAAGAAEGSDGSIRGARIVPEDGDGSEMRDALEEHAEYGVEEGSVRRLPEGDASVVLELELQRGGEAVRIRVQITGGGEARLLPPEAR